jgi:hypothetical protein
VRFVAVDAVGKAMSYLGRDRTATPEAEPISWVAVHEGVAKELLQPRHSCPLRSAVGRAVMGGLTVTVAEMVSPG